MPALPLTPTIVSLENEELKKVALDRRSKSTKKLWNTIPTGVSTETPCRGDEPRLTNSGRVSSVHPLSSVKNGSDWKAHESAWSRFPDEVLRNFDELLLIKVIAIVGINKTEDDE